MPTEDVISLPRWLTDRLEPVIQRWETDRVVPRLWQGDASVWTGADEADWLGWLRLTDDLPVRVEEVARVRPAALDDPFDHVLLLGMGGSSLGPEVLGSSLPSVDGAPRLLVLDSTDPDQIRAVEAGLTVERTLFIVSSKSGTTVETASLMEYFYDRVRQRRGGASAGSQFIGVTDPGSALEQTARERRFRDVFLGRPDVGGRFSVLSCFGLVPAAAAGFDVERLLIDHR